MSATSPRVTVRSHQDGADGPASRLRIDSESQIGTPLRDLVYEAVRQAIQRGHFRPGERLSEHRLTRELGISRTPIREALRKLEADRWLERRRAGTVVASLSIQDIVELFEVKALLETYAVRHAALRADRAAMAELRRINRAYRQACRDGRVEDVVQLNLDFHRRLCDLAGNRVLSAMVDLVGERMRLLTPLLVGDPEMLLASADDHERIADAIELGDAERAEAEVHGHLRRAHASYASQLGPSA